MLSIARRSLVPLRPAVRCCGLSSDGRGGSDEQVLVYSDRTAYFRGITFLGVLPAAVFGLELLLPMPPPTEAPTGFFAEFVSSAQWPLLGVGLSGLIYYFSNQYRNSYTHKLVLRRGNVLDVYAHSWTGSPYLRASFRAADVEAKVSNPGFIHYRERGTKKWLLLREESEWRDPSRVAHMLNVAVPGAQAPLGAVPSAAELGSSTRRGRRGAGTRRKPTHKAKKSE